MPVKGAAKGSKAADGDGGKVLDSATAAPDWVHEVINDFVYKVEASLDKLTRRLEAYEQKSGGGAGRAAPSDFQESLTNFSQRLEEQATIMSHQNSKVQEVLQQMSLLADATVETQEKGNQRDLQIGAMNEEIQMLKGTSGRSSALAESTKPVSSLAIASEDSNGDVSIFRKEMLRRWEDKEAYLDTRMKEDMQYCMEVNEETKALAKSCDQRILMLIEEVSLVKQEVGLNAVTANLFSLEAIGLTEAAKAESRKVLKKKETKLKLAWKACQERLHGQESVDRASASPGSAAVTNPSSPTAQRTSEVGGDPLDPATAVAEGWRKDVNGTGSLFESASSVAIALGVSGGDDSSSDDGGDGIPEKARTGIAAPRKSRLTLSSMFGRRSQR